ncbi:MAG: hypothetical protein II793_01875 [Bacteroidales bacterium]|nr:hypothetical protein [Bacteroidales bacterium]
MESNFDYNRFRMVFMHDLKSLWPRFGLTMLIIMLIPTAIWLFLCMGEPIESTGRLFIISICVLMVSIMAPSRLYKYCNTPNLGVHFAMLPVSKSEKFWSMLLMTAVVVPLIAFCGMALLDLSQAIALNGEWQWLFAGADWGDWIIVFPLLIVSFYAIVSTFFFTATLFKKHKVLYTVLWAMLIGYLLQFVLSILIILLISILGDGLMSGSYQTLLPRLEPIISFLGSMDDEAVAKGIYWGYMAVMALWSVAFYYAAHYRLKRMKY